MSVRALHPSNSQGVERATCRPYHGSDSEGTERTARPNWATRTHDTKRRSTERGSIPGRSMQARSKEAGAKCVTSLVFVTRFDIGIQMREPDYIYRNVGADYIVKGRSCPSSARTGRELAPKTQLDLASSVIPFLATCMTWTPK